MKESGDHENFLITKVETRREMANGISRPMGVTLVALLIVIDGLLAVLIGILGLFNLSDPLGVGLWGLIVSIVIGVIYLLVAKGILDGKRMARLVVGILTVINLLNGLVWLFTAPSVRMQGGVAVIFALVILALLYGGKARQYFASS